MATEDEMVGWHHPFNVHGFEQNSGDSEGQGNLACCSPWGRQESDTTQQLNNNSRADSGFATCLDTCSNTKIMWRGPAGIPLWLFRSQKTEHALSMVLGLSSTEFMTGASDRQVHIKDTHHDLTFLLCFSLLPIFRVFLSSSKRRFTITSLTLFTANVLDPGSLQHSSPTFTPAMSCKSSF